MAHVGWGDAPYVIFTMRVRKGPRTAGPFQMFRGHERTLFPFFNSFNISCLISFLRHGVKENDRPPHTHTRHLVPLYCYLVSPLPFTPPCCISDFNVVLCHLQTAASAPVCRLNCEVTSLPPSQHSSFSEVPLPSPRHT